MSSLPSTEATQAHRVGSLADLKSGRSVKAEVKGRAIAAFLVEGDVVTTNGVCPHAAGPIDEGEVEGTILTCPWHGWSFDLRKNGFCAEDPSLALEIYPCTVDGDDILVLL